MYTICLHYHWLGFSSFILNFEQCVGLTNSCGIMVNYRYYLDKLEDNSTKYQETKTVEASEQVKVLAMHAKLEAKKPSQL